VRRWWWSAHGDGQSGGCYGTPDAKQATARVGLLLAQPGIVDWGCGASGTRTAPQEPQSAWSSSAKRIGAGRGSARATAWQHSAPHSSFARMLGETIRFYGEARICSGRPFKRGEPPADYHWPRYPGQSGARSIAPPAATVDVPVGRARVFEVQAFPLTYRSQISSAGAPQMFRLGANVTVNMQAVTLNSIRSRPQSPNR
jgi:hypothetical protein